MRLHTDSHAFHDTLRAIQGRGDAVYKGAILAAAVLMLLTAFI